MPYDSCEIIRANDTWWEISLKKSNYNLSTLAFSWNDTMSLHGWLLKEPSYTFPSLTKTGVENVKNYTYWESEVVDVFVNVGKREGFYSKNDAELSKD